MTTEQITERRQSAQEVVRHLLDERQQLLTLLMQVTNVDIEKTDLSDKDLLEEFCQVLVDYIAASHFGLYGRISDGKERRQAIAELANKLYAKIEETTEIALAFSEKYDADNELSNFVQLQKDISLLGENLTIRFELEDQLIAVL